MNVFLIGYRGTGKSSVARLLGERLGWECVDADEEIERRAGVSIADLFAQRGEEAFRDLERQVVGDLADRERTVVSLGGGAVLREENRQAIAGRGTVCWLTATAASIHARLAADATSADRRPNLTARGGLPEITELLRRREPIYRQCADIQVDTEGKTPSQVADEIGSLLDDAGPAN